MPESDTLSIRTSSRIHQKERLMNQNGPGTHQSPWPLLPVSPPWGLSLAEPHPPTCAGTILCPAAWGWGLTEGRWLLARRRPSAEGGCYCDMVDADVSEGRSTFPCWVALQCALPGTHISGEGGVRWLVRDVNFYPMETLLSFPTKNLQMLFPLLILAIKVNTVTQYRKSVRKE